MSGRPTAKCADINEIERPILFCFPHKIRILTSLVIHIEDPLEGISIQIKYANLQTYKVFSTFNLSWAKQQNEKLLCIESVTENELDFVFLEKRNFFVKFLQNFLAVNKSWKLGTQDV